MPIIPAELLEWQIFYVELMKQLGLDPDRHYKSLLDGKANGDSKAKELERKLSNLQANLKRKEMVLRNLDSLLESDGFDSAVYSQKRNDHLREIKSLDQKLKETRQELDELRKRKTDEAEFAKFVSEADAFKAVTHKIMNLSFFPASNGSSVVCLTGRLQSVIPHSFHTMNSKPKTLWRKSLSTLRSRFTITSHYYWNS